MTNSTEPGFESFAYVSQLRHRTRVARDGSWFALLVFGVVVLLAMFFYEAPGLTSKSPGCVSFSGGFTCSSVTSSSRGIFGSGLSLQTPGFTNVSPWATTYWVIAITLGIVAIVAFYWLRARATGVAVRVWPFVTISLTVLILALVSQTWFMERIPEDFWMRGMQALIVVALAVAALAIVERSLPFTLYATGFVALAVLSCLYNVDNLFMRLGLGSSWNRSAQELPNLILPGAYLIVGGVAFYVARRWGFGLHVARRKNSDGE